MVLDRNGLLNNSRLKSEIVKLDEGEVVITELSGPDYMKLYTDPANRKMVDGVEAMEMGRFQAALIVYGAVDEKNERIFKDEDIEAVMRMSNTVFFKLAEAARKVNGMTGSEEKNSEETEADDSSSVSA